MRRKRLAISLTATALLLAGCAGSGATKKPTASSSPAGRIVFDRYSSWDPEGGDFEGAFITDPSGSHEHRIKLSPKWKDLTAVWSPDGKKLLVSIWYLIRPQGSHAGAESAIIRPNGSVVRLLNPKGLDASLNCTAWSPAGKKLLCIAGNDQRKSVEGIYSLRTDGTHLTRLTRTPYHFVDGAQGGCGGGDDQLSFSPDGKQFVFRRKRCGHGAQPWVDAKAALYVENIDGSGLHKIVDYGTVRPHAGMVQWSPGGGEILFGGDDGNLYTVHPDGSHITQIDIDTSRFGGFTGYAFAPAWSPDGRWIVFTMGIANGEGLDTVRLWRSHPDGSHLTKIAVGKPGVVYPSWGPAGS
jgi:Tol biopolymer transport system component